MPDLDPLPAVIDPWPSRLGRLGGHLLDMILPPRCLACGDLVRLQGGLCAECEVDIGFVTGRRCRCCGTPLPDASATAPLCGHCADEPPAYERARAALRYEKGGRHLVLRFKHGGRTDGAVTYAGWMLRAGGDLVARADLLLPVPVHRWRLVARGYNQAAVLALALGRLAGKPVLVDALEKPRASQSQQQLDAAARRANIQPAHFRLGNKGRRLVAERRVLLIDDVLTTGSTANACARCLLAGGAAAVDVLTLARVV